MVSILNPIASNPGGDIGDFTPLTIIVNGPSAGCSRILEIMSLFTLVENNRGTSLLRPINCGASNSG